jgi:AraC-like DNA-binding protein
MKYAEPEVRSGGFFKTFGPGCEEIVANSLDEALSVLRRYFPQKYTILDRNRRGTVRLRYVKLKSLTLGYGSFSPAMEIESSPDKPFYSLYFRRYGSAEYTVGKRTFTTSPMIGPFLPGMQPVRVITGPNWHTFATKLPPEVITLELSRLLDRDIMRPIEFNPAVDYTRGAGRQVRQLLGRLYEECRTDETASSPFSLGLQQMEDSLISLILEGLDHNYAKFINGPSREIAPWQLRAVEDCILESADQPHTLGKLAAVGGVSARSLQSMFLRRRGCSPMEFLRRVRLERVYAELSYPAHETTVTAAALKWGFLHLSRFAASYHKKFGEKPSETLRRSSTRTLSAPGIVKEMAQL